MIEKIDNDLDTYKKMEIILIGVSSSTKLLIRLAKYHNIKLICICDNNKDNFGKTIENTPIISPFQLQQMVKDSNNVVVQISSANITNVLEQQLFSIGVKKVISYDVGINLLISLNKINRIYDLSFTQILKDDVLFGMDNIIKLFNNDTFDENLLDILDNIFFNQFEFDLYTKNQKSLGEYPYLFNKNLVPYDKETFVVFQVNENIIYTFDKNSNNFEKIEINSLKETKYFFENLDNPLFVENEFNMFNLKFLVDNVRASEDVVYENHIYLYYDNIEKLSLLMCYCDLEPLLKNKKLVFLIGEEEKSMYPINFKEKFNIDYEAMKFQEIRPNEIKRIMVLIVYAHGTGGDFYNQVFDSHPNIICTHAFLEYITYSNEKNYIEFFDINEALKQLEEWLENRDYLNLRKVYPNFFNNDEEYINMVKKQINQMIYLNKNYHFNGFKDWIILNYLSYYNNFSINETRRQRISPMIMHELHTSLFQYDVKKIKEITSIFNSFHHYEFTPFRDPLHVLSRNIADTCLHIDRKWFHVFQDTIIWFFPHPFNSCKPLDFHINKPYKRGVFRFEDIKLNPKASIISIAKYFNFPLFKTLENCSTFGIDGNNSIIVQSKNSTVSGYGVKALYNNPVEEFLSEFDMYRFEMILFPTYSKFGYQPLKYDWKIFSDQEMYQMLSKPYKFEEIFIANAEEDFNKANPNVSFRSYLESSRFQFAKYAIAWKIEMEKLDLLNKKNYEMILPDTRFIINEFYKNRDSLPKINDFNMSFLRNGELCNEKKVKSQGYTNMNFINDNTSQGTVYWVTGLAGSGKTTIGTALYEKISKTSSNVVILDGDTWRKYIAFDVGYSQDERKYDCKRYTGLCQLLTEQGISVVCCTISMYNEAREYNREMLENYVEIFIKVSMETLYKRDQKGLYSSKAKNVVGVDIIPEYPKNPDIIIENDEFVELNTTIDKILNYKKESEL